MKAFVKYATILVAAIHFSICVPETAAQSVLEEVVVTAQKRTQSLQDVPLSVSVIGEDFIAQRGLVSLEEVARFAPNVAVTTQTLSLSVISFRGLAGGFNRGFEQSAGRYVDGVFTGRVASSSDELGDIARIEVLRGPQGTLFGNNSVTGTFNIFTNMPNEEAFQGELGSTYGKDNELRYNLMLTGPLSDYLAYRLYGAHREIDGTLENQAWELEGADRRMGDFDKDIWRGKLLYRPTEDVEVVLSYSGGSGTSNLGLASEMYVDRPVEQLRTRSFDIPVWSYWQSLVPGIVIDRYDRKIAHNTQPDYSLNSNQLDLTVNYELKDYTFTSITAYLDYRDQQYFDNDFSPSNFLISTVDEDYDQFSQEFRVVSPAGDKVEYVAGLYFLSTKIDLENSLALDFNDYGLDTSYDKKKRYKQDYSSSAAYSQITYHAGDAISVTAGLRYSYEKKDADIDQSYDNCVFFSTAVPDPLTCSLLPGVSDNGEIYEVHGSYTEDNLSPMLNVSWIIDDDWNSYARVATGFKSGGFSAEDSFLGENQNQFDPETSLTYELGLKGELLDGAGRVNVAAFYTEFDDLQVSSFTGGGGFSIGNAASAVTQGIEFDTQFLPTPNMNISATLGYTHARYDDYDNAGCTAAQDEAFLADTNPNKDSRCTQDLSGKELFRAPDWNASIGSDYFIPTDMGVEWRLGLDVIYSGQFYYAADLDLEDSQSDYTLVNAQIALIANDDRWEIAFRGLNLADRDVYGGGTDLPLVFGAHGGGFQRGRHWAFDVKYRFGARGR